MEQGIWHESMTFKSNQMASQTWSWRNWDWLGSEDKSNPIIYGRQLLEIGESNDLSIVKIIFYLPESSNSFTCFPHKGEASRVDYVLTILSIILHIWDFWISKQLSFGLCQVYSVWPLTSDYPRSIPLFPNICYWDWLLLCPG